MKITLHKIFSCFTTATVLALPIIFLPSLPAGAIEVPQRVTNGLYRSSAEDFFREGQRKFEREIPIITERRLSTPENILEISDDLRVEERLSPLEMRNRSPQNKERSNMRRYRQRR